MLVLSRKVGEAVQIGDQVKVTIVRIAGGGVRLGIEAPATMTIVRQELLGEPPAATPPTRQSTAPTLSAV